ncbi:TPA: conjugal transfer protein TrbD [Escherichia coli]|uniref:conjugal transfer protein TrbD n=1 Tax=Escherichia sp. MOD1-EC6842 TaxID=2093899 RepID=UPI000CF771E3|nr:conjugal transfer protein TrbD [Escherichia sp. MOD1-EC6842]EEK0314526.1 conjugal transfer protein TrbD [Salmonella enterica subsp. enterica serovar Typhimurium]HAY0139171.1 conjugal transfer protein TrbD [Escherichia coli]HAY0252165.1 conjugal transfer protein TrbD [Escherichia coli]HAY0444028.1 conjugal transfer protein TrbD [Escherichia coli]HAY0490402.1 conjugal transfer protein TrbD [Escherichia coli]
MFISLMTEQSEITEIKMNMRNIIKSSPQSLPHNFNIAAVGVMKKGMSMSLFSSPGHIMVVGQTCAGKANLTAELISAVVGNNKKGEGQ